MKRLFLLAVALSACLEGDPNPYAQPSAGGGGPTPINPGTACSQSSNVPVSLSLNNRTAYTLRVHWVDYGCQEVDYGALPPGGVFTTSTSATHPWRLRDSASRALVYEYVTGTSPSQSVDVQLP